MAEEEGQYSLCTYNLHVLICRLGQKEAERGWVAFSSEYWIENKIQYCKAAILNRTTQFPELTLVKHLLLGQALSNLSAGGKVFSVNEVMGPASRPMRGTNMDDGDDRGCQLLGSGSTLSSEEAEEVRSALRLVWRHSRDRLEHVGWGLDALLSAQVRLCVLWGGAQ